MRSMDVRVQRSVRLVTDAQFCNVAALLCVYGEEHIDYVVGAVA